MTHDHEILAFSACMNGDGREGISSHSFLCNKTSILISCAWARRPFHRLRLKPKNELNIQAVAVDLVEEVASLIVANIFAQHRSHLQYTPRGLKVLLLQCIPDQLLHL